VEQEARDLSLPLDTAFVHSRTVAQLS
jgi:hypothetical protein